jgi:hypothetical protein
MPAYEYPNDGNIHVRQSDLSRCTPGQIKRLVMEKMGELTPFSSGDTSFGSDRHDMLEEEVRETKRLPKVFLQECAIPAHYKNIEIDMVEQKMVTEIYPGVIFHCTPDAVSSSYGLIADWKITTQLAKKYASSKQLMVYAYILMLRGISIKEYAFLIERWDKDPVTGEKNHILEYDCYIREIFEEDIRDIKINFIKPRIEYLVAAVELYREGKL